MIKKLAMCHPGLIISASSACLRETRDSMLSTSKHNEKCENIRKTVRRRPEISFRTEVSNLLVSN